LKQVKQVAPSAAEALAQVPQQTLKALDAAWKAWLSHPTVRREPCATVTCRQVAEATLRHQLPERYASWSASGPQE